MFRSRNRESEMLSPTQTFCLTASCYTGKLLSIHVSQISLYVINHKQQHVRTFQLLNKTSSKYRENLRLSEMLSHVYTSSTNSQHVDAQHDVQVQDANVIETNCLAHRCINASQQITVSVN